MMSQVRDGLEQYAVSPSVPVDRRLSAVIAKEDAECFMVYLNYKGVELTAYAALTFLCANHDWEEGIHHDFFARIFDELLKSGVILENPETMSSPLSQALTNGKLSLLEKMAPYLNGHQVKLNKVLASLYPPLQAVDVFKWALDHIVEVGEKDMVSIAMVCWDFFEIVLERNPTWDLSRVDRQNNNTLLMALFFANDMSAEQFKGWIDRLLEAGVDIDAAYKGGAHYTVLFVAANCRPQWLSYLIQKGANPYLLDHRGNNFIHTLMSSSPLGALFLENDMGLLNKFNENGYTPLHALSEYMYKHTFQRDEFVFLLEWALRCGGDFSIKGEYHEEAWVAWVLHNPSSLQDWINRGMQPPLDVKGEALAQLLYRYPEGWKGLDILLDHGMDVSLLESDDRIQPENLAWWERRQLQGQTMRVSVSEGQPVSRL